MNEFARNLGVTAIFGLVGWNLLTTHQVRVMVEVQGEKIASIREKLERIESVKYELDFEPYYGTNNLGWAGATGHRGG